MGSVYIDNLEERAYGMGLGRATIPGRHTPRASEEPVRRTHTPDPIRFLHVGHRALRVAYGEHVRKRGCLSGSHKRGDILRCRAERFGLPYIIG